MFETSPRPNKRARLSPSPTMSNSAPVDDVDDIYGTPSANNTPALQTAQATSYIDAKQQPSVQSPIAGIPGLGSFPPAAPLIISQPQPGQVQHAAQVKTEEKEDKVTEAAIEQPATAAAEDAAPIVAQAAIPDATSALFDALGNNDELNKNLPAHAAGEPELTSSSTLAAEPVAADPAAASTSTKAPIDREFIEAAQAQKGAEGAEWQYDTSDAESSDDSSSDDSSSDEDDSDDEDYPLLDPATAARMLMDEGGADDEDGGNKAGGGGHLRTKNELPEEIVPKPDVTVTPDMKITPLGAVQHVVEHMILIKAFTSGEYQVLESGSVLCLENREVIGIVADLIGRVEEPLYSVAFTRPSDISDLGIATNTKIFYVDDHSTYVFTQPLKNMKGTDASNLHDEEVADEEMEFSDDEAEAAYKRAKKEAKKGARAARDQPSQGPAAATAKPYTGGAMNYDDEPEAEDMYTPLARPDNLQDMMVNAPPARRQFAERGGRGRGRGRGGDRGRGDRGRGGRGGRGGADSANQRKGPSNSYPDTHNAGAQSYTQQSLPQKPTVPQQMQQMPQMQQMWNQVQPQMNAPFGFPQFNQQQFPPPPPVPQTQSPFQNMQFGWPPNPQFFNQGQQQQSYNQGQQQQPYQFPGTSAGTFFNPAFLQQQHQQQQQAPPAPAQSAPQPPPSAEQIQNAADLFRRLQEQQQQQQQ
ncbi:hypothetical protein JADG_007740 [Aureobasidium aubasidani]|nr:hypothetical protein JADG_007740 [Aureobasidium pullulans]